MTTRTCVVIRFGKKQERSVDQFYPNSGASSFEWLSLWPRRRDFFLGVIASAKNLAYLSGNVLNKGSFCIHVCAAIDHIDETHRAVEHDPDR
jgi:hypothetical protein